MPIWEAYALARICVSTCSGSFCDTPVMKMKIPSVPIVLIILLFGLLAKTHAVIPAPDGGYPGGNTAEGQSALLSLTTGGFNTAIGYLSLRANTTANFNTAIGAGTLLANTTGDSNTATGVGALFSNTTARRNTANGVFALFYNTSGQYNTANGGYALFSNTTGDNNTAIGDGALDKNITGIENTANGDAALFYNTTGDDNTASGVSALQSNTTGSNNVAVGYDAGSNLTTGDNNIDIGYNVVGLAGESNTIRIGNGDITDTFIRGISGATAAGGAAVFVNSNGKLGTMTSSARFKDEIKPMGKSSEAIFSLRPVTFHYKKQIDPTGIQQFGLVAEDVEKVNPDLVVRDENGKVNSVRYEQVNAMLLNEFLKEHRKVGEQDRKIQEQEATIAQLKLTVAQQQKGMEVVTRRLEEQAAQIQRVSAQVKLSKPASQTVVNSP